jgi:hypothetical protein
MSSESSEAPEALEADPRFPSGPWTGFFLDARVPGKHRMELRLAFHSGVMTGDGRDFVGAFRIKGRYDLTTGRCHWHKRYVGKHDVYYQGYNEGKGIWGVWEVSFEGATARGGFHIWPEGMPDPSGDRLVEEAELPADKELVEIGG